MEMGEIDLNALLQERMGKRVSLNFIRHTWEQVRLSFFDVSFFAIVL
jgi:hypothetical protein